MPPKPPLPPKTSKTSKPPVTPVETTAPTPDVDADAGATALPGAHQGGFQRLPTAPVDVPATDSAPAEDGEPLPEAQWVTSPSAPRSLAGGALTMAVIALIVSFFVGWGFPLGLVAIVLAIISLRRPRDSTVVAAWALALGILSVLYSGGWLLWAAGQAGLAE
nr:hypothetical protein [Microbacterium bovistercoris]